MNVLDRKLLRDLWHSMGLLLAVTSIMACGVVCYVALSSAYDNLTTAQRTYYDQCRMADFSIELKKAPVAEMSRLDALPGIVDLRYRIQFFAAVDLAGASEPINGLVLSLPDSRQPVINDIVLKRGGYFTPYRDNEVIVNDAFARRHGIHPGNWVHLLVNNRRQELLVVGTAVSSEFIYLLGPGTITPDPEHFGVFYVKTTFAEDVYDFEGATNQVLGRLSPLARLKVYELLDRAEALLDEFGVFATVARRDQPSHRFVDNEIKGLGTFGKIMPGIFLSVAALVLNVLMKRLVDQQRVTVGTLKAIGYTDLEVFSHFVKFGLVIGLSGGMIGCLLGHRMAAFMTSVYQMFFQFPNLENELHAPSWLAGIGISAFCGLLGTLYGARGVLKLQAAEAMRQAAPRRGGRIALERFGWLWRRLSFGWRMTLRNVFRQKLRTAAGVFAAAMGAGIMVNGLMMALATVWLVTFQFEFIQRSDIDLAFKDEHGWPALDEVRHLTGVDRAEPVLDVACTFANGHVRRKGGISGLVAGNRLTIPRDAAGKPLVIPATGLVMSRKMAEVLKLKRGKPVEVTPVKGNRRAKTAVVAEVSDSYIGMAVYANIEYLAGLVDEELALSGAQLAVNPDPRAKAALYHELKHTPGVRSVTAREDLVANVNETLVKNQRVFIGLLVMFAGVIFCGSIINSSLISLAERRREVATWVVMGYTPWQIGGLFLREALVVNGLGILLGLPLGYLLTVVMVHLYDTEMFRIPIVDPKLACGWTIALGAVYCLLAHGFVQRAIHRLNWLEALNAKE